jgi:2-dehydropantoate 2-reductase
MRIAVMGTGAVGGYFGGKLAAAGCDVAFLARGEHLQALRHNGLIVKSPGGDFHIRDAVFTAEPAEIGVVDLVLFCVKSYDTQACAARLTPLIGPQTVILSLQNGIDNPDKIIQLWGSKRTLAGVVYLGAKVLQSGIIEHSAAGRVVFGRLEGGADEVTTAVQQAFASARIPAEVANDIRAVQWQKLLWNAPFCAIACLTRAGVKDIITADSLKQLVIDCMNEVREAANTEGIELDPALINDTLSFSKSLGDFKPSMLQDLEARKPLEYEAFNGVVVELLRQTGKQAPINLVFYRALKYLENSRANDRR